MHSCLARLVSIIAKISYLNFLGSHIVIWGQKCLRIVDNLKLLVSRLLCKRIYLADDLLIDCSLEGFLLILWNISNLHTGIQCHAGLQTGVLQIQSHFQYHLPILICSIPGNSDLLRSFISKLMLQEIHAWIMIQRLVRRIKTRLRHIRSCILNLQIFLVNHRLIRYGTCPVHNCLNDLLSGALIDLLSLIPVERRVLFRFKTHLLDRDGKLGCSVRYGILINMSCRKVRVSKHCAIHALKIISILCGDLDLMVVLIQKQFVIRYGCIFVLDLNSITGCCLDRHNILVASIRAKCQLQLQLQFRIAL